MDASMFQSLLQPGAVSIVFQPIVDLSGSKNRVVAMEALARGPKDTPLESPTALFGMARRLNAVGQLDRVCITAALNEARLLPDHLDVFINVHPTTLCQDCGFPAFLAERASEAGIAPERITLEVLEHARVTECQCRQLRVAVQVLRGYGVRLAIDDVCGAPDDVRRALSLDPEYLKVDSHVVRSCDSDLRMRALLHAIAVQAAATGARVIAEGIEELRDLRAVASAGILLAQGYLLSRPAEARTFDNLALMAHSA